MVAKYTFRQSKVAESAPDRHGHAVDGGQPPFDYQLGGTSASQLLYHLIATVLLAAISGISWPSMTGCGPWVNAHTVARTGPHAVNRDPEYPTPRTISPAALPDGEN
jgi:hypothetical protein